MVMQVHTGDILIAPPALKVTEFAGSVILLINEQPAQGFVLNHPTAVSLSAVAPHIPPHMDADLHWGGPVNTTTVWMLHSSEWRMHNTRSITAQWSVTTNIHMFSALCQGSWPLYWRVFSGSCAWAPGQLQQEITALTPLPHSQGWLTAEQPLIADIMLCDSAHLWQHCTELAKQQAVAQWF